MITGAHAIVYSKDAEADRAFFADVLRFPSVDAGRGWLIFELPPAEVAFHPGKENDVHELYLMCKDLTRTVATLKKKKVRCSKVISAPWGSLTHILLPGGGKIGLYQPEHPTAVGLKK